MKTQDTNFNPKMSSEGELIIPTSEFKLILDFMPEYNEPTGDGDTTIIDWNALMPVVEKISQMDEVASIEFFVGVTIRIWTSDQMIESMGEGIEPVYKAVVEFIKWHKTKTP